MNMNPVVLISFPNLPHFLGTFDTANFRSWWRSSPFPEAIQLVKKGMHIYGRSHLAIAQRTDGRWAIYRSKNYGIDWERVWLAAVGEIIYDLVLITYGRAIMNTSTGFYETVKAGTSWTKVASLPAAPNAPAFCNIGGGDVLVCTDGRYIWRSTNIARAWTQVCDMHQVPHYTGYPYIHPYYYTNLSVPTIAGACGRIYAANGPFLVRSDDGGSTWNAVRYWEDYGGTLPESRPVPPRNIIYYRLWPIGQPKFLISQIKISSVDGVVGDDVVFLIKIDDISPVSGESHLYSWLFKSYSIDPYKNNYYQPVFRQYLTPAESGQQIDSFDVPVLGADYNDKIVFSAQTRIDPATGNPIPSLKYSTDGGQTWIDINLNQIQIGNPDGSPISGGSMIGDNFAKITWVAPPCNNQGSYSYLELNRRQCQSYEHDALVKAIIAINQNIDAKVSKNVAVEQSTDAKVEAEIPVQQHIDSMLEGTRPKAYRIDRTLEGTATKEESIDSIVTIDHDIDMQADAHFWARPYQSYRLGAMLHQRRASIGQVDVIIEYYRLNERLSDMERKFPQFMDIDVPDIPYKPYNAAEESI